MQGFFRFTPLAANVCRATFVFQLTAGGKIPVRVMNFGVKKALGLTEELRDEHERNGKAVDAELRGSFPPPPLLQHLNEEQTRIAHSCLALETESVAAASTNSSSKKLLAVIRGNSAAARARAVRGSWVELEPTSPFVSMSMKYTTPAKNESR
jgi:hypothetical protein